ncbi:hypothetical protein NCS57_01348800 [Fusarium keratoplasticum]|uniref:Uncharacterized protein n=1 Tax=Fusarium keratoplasticum TaxID=1328300 RepID=A0ACC0QG42_9HYPO|nr:hypothetical protein NCS57_01348800 [Fusarium keratoplasticum]KAI8652832.1 hypothetical protein NCS57_01348800 [Fusarium keratoplasticum]KAI8653542.1 hypothetical protein NCS55_01341300 [Fusarium keratoplasticum]
MAQSEDTSDMPDMTEDFFDCEYPDPKDLSPAQHEVSEIMLKMKDDPTLMGIRMLGKDGIFRSLDADRNVVDAVACTPPIIKALLDRMPYDAEAEKSFRGVDGTKTPKEQWYDPLPGILPPPLEEEHRERSEEVLEGYRKQYYERRKKIDNGTATQCAVCLMSDNDLGPGLGKRKAQD